jgi:hypothetical protein
MAVSSGALKAQGRRRLSPVRWNQDGCPGFEVHACEEVPTFDDGMIRRALLRGALVWKSEDALTQAINRELWAIGYVATVQSDPIDSSIVVEVSKPR